MAWAGDSEASLSLQFLTWRRGQNTCFLRFNNHKTRSCFRKPLALGQHRNPSLGRRLSCEIETLALQRTGKQWLLSPAAETLRSGQTFSPGRAENTVVLPCFCSAPVLEPRSPHRSPGFLPPSSRGAPEAAGLALGAEGAWRLLCGFQCRP